MGGPEDAATGEARLRGAFALALDTPLALPGHWRAGTDGLPTLAVRAATAAALEAAWSGPARDGWDGRVDGRAFRVEHGLAGDLRMELEDAAVLLLSPAGDALGFAAHPQEPVRALRVLLDSALFTASLALGREALHAGAVAVDGRLVAVTGPSGAGKSTLVGALLDIGGTFVTDDVLMLAVDGDGTIAGHPGPPVLTLPAKAPAPPGGHAVAHLDDERWWAVDGAERAVPLAAVVSLERPGATSVPPWQRYLGHLLDFPKTPERTRARFALAGDLAERVPLLRVTARETPADGTANMIVRALDTGLLDSVT